MTGRVHRPRWSVRDELMAPFYPRGFNSYNSRISPLFLRKWRGNRSRSRRP